MVILLPIIVVVVDLIDARGVEGNKDVAVIVSVE